MEEHRNLARWQINRHAKIKLDQAVNEVNCHIKDINYKGASVTLGVKLPEGAAFKLHLKLSEDCALHAEAWVVWRRIIGGINHYGLYFSRFRDADKEMVYRFINKFCPRQIIDNWWRSPEVEEEAKGGENMYDRRIFERFKKEFPARFIDLKSGNEGLAKTIDVSAKGIGLSSAQELKAHTTLEIWLEISDNQGPLYTRGEVVWSRPEGIERYYSGIELEKADLMGISRLLRV